MSFSINDQIRFKTKKELLRDFGNDDAVDYYDIEVPHGFNPVMGVFCGKKARIVNIRKSEHSLADTCGIYIVNLDFNDESLNEESKQWTISTDMIVKISNLSKLPLSFWDETTSVDKLEEMV
jgi:hypothetical protein